MDRKVKMDEIWRGGRLKMFSKRGSKKILEEKFIIQKVLRE
jgi:hypothetical protein